MKRTIELKYILYVGFMFFISFSVYAQKGDYKIQLEQYIGDLYDANNTEELKVVLNDLEKIKKPYENDWHTLYYKSYALMRLASLTEDKQLAIKYLKKAEKFIQQALIQSPNNSEVVTIQGYLYVAMVPVKPVSNANELLKIAMMKYDEAIQLDNKNPRPVYLKGQLLYEFDNFDVALYNDGCSYFKEAEFLFNNYSSTDDLNPIWGLNANTHYLNMCNEKP